MSTDPNEEKSRQILDKYYYDVLKKKMFAEIVDNADHFSNPVLGTAEEIIQKYGTQLGYLCHVYSAYKPRVPDKKPVGKEPLGKNEFRCFSCASVIREQDNACPSCGWTWK